MFSQIVYVVSLKKIESLNTQLRPEENLPSSPAAHVAGRLVCLLPSAETGNLYAVRKQQLELDMEQQTGSK